MACNAALAEEMESGSLPSPSSSPAVRMLQPTQWTTSSLLPRPWDAHWRSQRNPTGCRAGETSARHQGPVQERTCPGSPDVPCPEGRGLVLDVPPAPQTSSPKMSRCGHPRNDVPGVPPSGPEAQILTGVPTAPEAFSPQEINTRGESANIGSTTMDQSS